MVACAGITRPAAEIRHRNYVSMHGECMMKHSCVYTYLLIHHTISMDYVYHYVAYPERLQVFLMIDGWMWNVSGGRHRNNESCCTNSAWEQRVLALLVYAGHVYVCTYLDMHHMTTWSMSIMRSISTKATVSVSGLFIFSLLTLYWSWRRLSLTLIPVVQKKSVSG